MDTYCTHSSEHCVKGKDQQKVNALAATRTIQVYRDEKVIPMSLFFWLLASFMRPKCVLTILKHDLASLDLQYQVYHAWGKNLGPTEKCHIVRGP